MNISAKISVFGKENKHMRDIFRRCLALVLVLSLVLSTGLVSAFATGSDADVTVLNTDNAIAAKPDADQELIHESLDNEANEIPGFDPMRTWFSLWNWRARRCWTASLSSRP